MNGFELIAVTAADHAPDAALLAEEEMVRVDGGAEAERLAAAGLPAGETPLAAILSPLRRRLWRTRKAAGRDLVSFQKRLERLHAQVPLLPAAPGARFEDLGEASVFLAANAETLAGPLARFGALTQHQAVLEIPGQQLLSRARSDTAFAEPWAEVEAALRRGDQKGMGARLQAIGEAARARWGAVWSERLAAAADDAIRLPEGGPEVALNTVLLGGADAAERIETTLEAIDAEWEGRLRIRLIGPAPASSFASIRVERPDAEEVFAAAEALEISADAAFDAVQQAYRAAMKRAHPDVLAARGVDDGGAAARRIAEAARTLRRVARAREAMARLGAEGPPALARIHRDGDAAEATASRAA